MGLPFLMEQMEPRLLLDGTPSLPAPPQARPAPAPAAHDDLLGAPPGEPLDALASATPADLTAETQGGPAGPGADADLSIIWDAYEPDNTYSDANVIVLESPTDQFHNFHSPTDEDWVKCYALEDVWYEFSTAYVGPNCDPVIDLYAFDGTTLLAHVDDWGIGQGESLIVQCPADGVYYARLTYRWFGPGIFPEYGTDYSLSAKRCGPSVVLHPGFIQGTVCDAATGDEIADAIVVAERSGSGMSQPNGVYAIGLAEGTYTVTAWAEGYQPKAYSGVVVPAGGTVERDFALASLGGAAAQVAGVRVGSTSWEAAFVDELGSDFGYAVPEGAAQLDELPWVNIDRVSIAFTEDVTVGQEDLSVYGVDVPQYPFSGFSYDASSFTATWTLASPIAAADKLLLALDDGVTDLAGNALDGEWTDGVSTWPSGDGLPGGDFRFRLNVLPGDVDGSGEVRSSDVIKVRRKTNTAVGNEGYSIHYDVDGSGEIRSSDTIKIRRKGNTDLPEAAPTPPPPAEPSQASPVGMSPFAEPEIEVSDLTVDFEPVPVGWDGWRSRTLEISNTGDADLAIFDVSLSDATHFWFGWSDSLDSIGEETPSVLRPGESCTVFIQFGPQAEGSHSSTLRIVTSDADEGTVEVALSGDGVGLPSGSDGYEEDDTFQTAHLIALGGVYDEPRPGGPLHNFHCPGDQDWVTFHYVGWPNENSGFALTAVGRGDNADPVIRLYASDGTTLLAEADWTGPGATEYLTWQTEVGGQYYAQVTHHDPGAWGVTTGYSLYADDWVVVIGWPAFLAGTVVDAETRAGIEGALVDYWEGIAVTQSDGSYAIATNEGTCPVTVSADGYGSATSEVLLRPLELVEGHEIALSRLGSSAPAVSGLSVASTAWGPRFHAAAGKHGYAVPEGAAQLDELSWVNIDQVRIAFTEDVTVGQEDLSVYGVDVPPYAFSGFSYDASSFTATWTLASPLAAADKLLLVLADSVTDRTGTALDGEWTDGVSTWPSGDGLPGGDFRFRLNVLPGDVDGSGEVRSSDVIKVRRKTNTAVGSEGYSIHYDVDGSAEIRSSDVIKVRRKGNTDLPEADPTPPPAPGPPADACSLVVFPEIEVHDRDGDPNDHAIAFGDVPVHCDGSLSRGVVISNVGWGYLTLIDVVLSDPVNYWLSWAEAGEESGFEPPWIEPGGQGEVSVHFDPICEGEHDATLTLITNDEDERSIQIALSGSGTGLPTGADEYEDDDDYLHASPLEPSSLLGQQHNFHQSGDEDWAVFNTQGMDAPAQLSVTAVVQGADADPVIRLYDADGSTLLAEAGAEEDWILSWVFQPDTVYFIQLSNRDPSVWGDEAAYCLHLDPSSGVTFPTFVAGRVVDAATGHPIGGALVHCEFAEAVTQPDGTYRMLVAEGTHALVISADGYADRQLPAIRFMPMQFIEVPEVRLAGVGAAAPAVAGVRVGSSGWALGFPLAIDGVGYAIPAGPGQLDTLPWHNVDQVMIAFTKDVLVAQEDLAVYGVTTPQGAFSGFSYDAFSFVATWTLADPVAADRILLALSDAVTDREGNALDGEWIDGVSTGPSGDAAAGGDFRFRLNVLPGDVDGSGEVRSSDVIKVRRKGNTSPVNWEYSTHYDVDGSSEIRSSDVIKVRRKGNTQLPSGEPPSEPDVAAAGPAVAGVPGGGGEAVAGAASAVAESLPARSGAAMATSGPEIEVTDGQGDPDDLAIAFADVSVPSERWGAHSVTISNVGDADLAISSAVLSDYADYWIRWDGDGFRPKAIQPGESREIWIKFRPPDVGDYGAVLTIATDDADEQTTEVVLSGRGVGLPSGQDEYEVDDHYWLARPITVGQRFWQPHTFHRSGDADWVAFDAVPWGSYLVIASHQGTDSDPVIHLYDTDGTTLLATADQSGPGGDEYLAWDCQAAGVYYVRITHHDPQAGADGSGYCLRIGRTDMALPPLPGFLSGTVLDSETGQPVEGAVVAGVSGSQAVTESDGSYRIGATEGTYTLIVSAEGYVSRQVPEVTIRPMELVEEDVSLLKIRPPPPVAADDAYRANPAGTLTVPAPGVLGNDGDSGPGSQGLTATPDIDTSHGELTLNADGSFEYTPAPGFYGEDGFTYTAGDGEAESQPATVTLVVAAAGDTDLDGDVDYYDYVAARDGFGMTEGATVSDGDCDLDGDVDHLDYLALKVGFGRPVAPGEAGGGVAGPGSDCRPQQDLPDSTPQAHQARQQSSPAFTDIGAGLVEVTAAALAWGDYDGDGDMDLAAAGNSGSGRITVVYRNDGGTFADIGAGLAGVSGGSLAWGDYDRDGDLDLAVAGRDWNNQSVSRIYRNDGGTFVDANAGLVEVRNSSLAWGDYDNDGDLDLALAGAVQAGEFLTSIYRNEGGAFVDAEAELDGSGTGDLAWGDYDSDGDLDLVVTGYGAAGTSAKVYRNDAGTFTDSGAALLGVHSGSLAWGDYDADGDLDLAMAGTPGDVETARIYRNNGGVFTDVGAALTGMVDSSLAWGDYDNDGDLDLVVTGYRFFEGARTRLYRNDGGVFADSGAALPDVGTSAVAWGDFDSDGDLDLVLAGFSAGTRTTGVYRNDTTVPNTAPAAPEGLSAMAASGAATFSWGMASDAETPALGLTYNLRVGTSPGADDVLRAMADPVDGRRRVPGMGNVQHNLSWAIQSLMPGTTYYWSVQAVDTSFLASAWAPEQMVVVAGPPRPEIEIRDNQGDPNDYAIDFGLLPPGCGWLFHRVTVSNVGDADLAVHSVTLGDTANYWLGWQPDGFAVGSIAGGESADVMIMYQPNAEGEHDTTLTVVTDDADEGTVCVSLFSTAALPTGTDDYEVDDAYDAAKPIDVDDTVGQARNFHEPDDQDWVSFFGETSPPLHHPRLYTIVAEALGPSADTRIQVYDTDGTTLLAEVDDAGPGESELLEWYCAANGTYYARVRSHDPNVWGEGTEYCLYVSSEGVGGTWPAFLTGVVTDAGTGRSIEGASLTWGPGFALTEHDGTYGLAALEGTDTLTVSAEGYRTLAVPGITVRPFELREGQDVALTRVENIAPAVAGVWVASAGWSAAFLDEVGPAGYAVPAGAGQLDELPWMDVDQVTIAFTEDVAVGQGDLSITGVRVPQYAFSAFEYDSEAFTARWTLGSPLAADKLLLTLSDAVTDLEGNALDGEWIDGVSTGPSGDAAAGGDFRFRLNVLPGDVDGSGEVRSSDTIKVRRKGNTAPGDADYSVFYDADGSAEIRSSDVIKVRRRSNTELPPGEPAALPAAGRTNGVIRPSS